MKRTGRLSSDANYGVAADQLHAANWAFTLYRRGALPGPKDAVGGRLVVGLNVNRSDP
jgi:hypothetical protein